MGDLSATTLLASHKIPSISSKLLPVPDPSCAMLLDGLASGGKVTRLRSLKSIDLLDAAMVTCPQLNHGIS